MGFQIAQNHRRSPAGRSHRRTGGARIIVVLCLFAVGCAHASHEFLQRPELDRLTDGVFSGQIDSGLLKAQVEVTVEEGAISALEIVDVLAYGWRHEAVTEKFPGQVVAAQSPEVDAISGATGSYQALKIATDRALAKSVKQD